MDYEALKDQWSDVEYRDGIRLSWNTFPSTRMVGLLELHRVHAPPYSFTVAYRKRPDLLSLLPLFTLP
jgi:hypothetical protein